MVVSSEEVIQKLLHASENDRQRAGRLFERFVKAFLKTHNHWGKLFREVWLWSEYPDRGKRVDTGVDLVGEDIEGNRWAIQAKFYETSKVSHDDVSRFIASSPPDEFKYRMLFTSKLLHPMSHILSKVLQDLTRHHSSC